MKIGLLSPIMSKANLKPFNNLISLIQSLNYIITIKSVGIDVLDDIQGENPKNLLIHRNSNNKISSAVNFILFQLKLSYKLISLSKDVDIWIFYMGYYFIIPLISAKLIGKKVILDVGSSPYDSRSFHLISNILSKFMLKYVDIIVVYSQIVIDLWNLDKYRDKVFISHEHFFDKKIFCIKKNIKKRENVIGYIGRFSEEKGIMNLIKSIELVPSDFTFLIIGNGDLKVDIHNYVQEKCLDNVIIYDWIPNEEIGNYLNKMKLLVIPSYSEGLPNILIESMACGTPVLATPVGAIPDLIKNGENGFIMGDNSPSCISENIINAIDHPNLNEIVEKSQLTISHFTFEKEKNKWNKVISYVRNGYNEIL